MIELSPVAKNKLMTEVIESVKRRKYAAAHGAEENGLMWIPQPGAQTLGKQCLADELFYGGQAGGGKTDLFLGLAFTEHMRSIMFRREFVQLEDVVHRSREIVGSRGRFNENKYLWRDLPRGATVQFGAMANERDWRKYRGRPHDLISFDELPEFTENQYRGIVAWNRSTIPGQRCRVASGGNPPTDEEGAWVIAYWGPWLDKDHPHPAEPGELRWFARIDDKDVMVEGPAEIKHKGEMITPRSRTFIPASLEDNPLLATTGYRSVLQGLPEPLRSQLLYGDFTIGTADQAWQVLKREWIIAAQERWEAMGGKPLVVMSHLGVDPNRGGPDKMAIAPFYDWEEGDVTATFVDTLLTYSKEETSDGFKASRAIMDVMPDLKVPVFIDPIGIGSSPLDILRDQKVDVTSINFGAGTKTMDRTGKYKMRNVRAEAYWKLREAFEAGLPIALPPDRELLQELVAPTWKLTTGGILIEPKEIISKRLGRSPDKADALVIGYLGGGQIGWGGAEELGFMEDEDEEWESRWA